MTDSQCMLNIVAMKTLRKNAMMNMAQIGLIQMTLPISLPIIQCMSNIVATRNVQRLHILETTNGELGFRKFLTDLELTVGWNARSDWFHGELHYVFYNLCIWNPPRRQKSFIILMLTARFPRPSPTEVDQK